MERSADADVPTWVLDALLGVAVTLGISLIIATEQGAQPDPLAYLFAVGFGALMLARRRFPRIMIILTVLGIFAYYTLDFPQIGVAVPVVAALFAVADAGLTLWAVLAGIVVFTVSMSFRLLGDEPVARLIGYETVSNLALIVMAIALGVSTRIHRVGKEQRATIERLSADRAEAEAELRIRADRERLSRDLHDTVGHTMSVISLQAGVAGEAIGTDDQVATAAVERIRQASSQSLAEVRSMVRLLRSDDASTLRSLSRLEELFAPVRGAGITIDTELDFDPTQLSAAVDAIGFRVVQESLTNIVRHSGADRAQVHGRLVEDALELIITDDGIGPTDQTPGQGLIGMRERVRSLGGTVTTGAADGGGFRVLARIPTSGGEPSR